ncbi:MAG: hypothetical protein CMH54_11200 [Myxococcales bacterium]|nr:hypothetical protein [Myxococcales bacterium]
MAWIGRCFVSLVVLVFFSSPVLATAEANERTAVSAFTIATIDGKQVQLSDYKGKVVVISFWATWCVPCAQELDLLQTYYDKYRDQGLVILALSIDGPETFSQIRTFVDRKGWTMPILLDPEGSVAAVLNPRSSTPFSLYIDRNGLLDHAHTGFTSGDAPMIEARIQKLLGEKGSTNRVVAGGSVQTTNRSAVEWHVDNKNVQDDDDDYGLALDRIDVVGSFGDWTTSLRAEAWRFYSPPNDQYEDAMRFERVTLQHQRGPWRVMLGDHFRQLGRGIAFSLRKVDELGLDVSLFGPAVTYATDLQTINLFGGRTNPANMDAISQKWVEDTHDKIFGGSYEVRPVAGVSVQTFGLLMLPQEQALAGLAQKDDRWMTGGASVQFKAGPLSLYLEGDMQKRRVADQDSEGLAGYGVLDLSLGNTIVLFEGLYLDKWELLGSTNSALNSPFNYSQPPTLERIDQEVLENRDVMGGRIRLEQSMLDRNLVLHINTMVRVNNPDAPEPLHQKHVYAGFEYWFQERMSHLSSSAGYRDENGCDGTNPLDCGDTHDIKSMVHFDVDYLQKLTPTMFLHLVTMNEFRTLESHDYIRGSTFVGLEWTKVGALTFEFGYDTQNESGDVANYFFAGILSAEVWQDGLFRLTAGTQRGGLKCIAGICRVFPGFAGVRGELISRF